MRQRHATVPTTPESNIPNLYGSEEQDQDHDHDQEEISEQKGLTEIEKLQKERNEILAEDQRFKMELRKLNFRKRIIREKFFSENQTKIIGNNIGASTSLTSLYCLVGLTVYKIYQFSKQPENGVQPKEGIGLFIALCFIINLFFKSYRHFSEKSASIANPNKFKIDVDKKEIEKKLDRKAKRGNWNIDSKEFNDFLEKDYDTRSTSWLAKFAGVFWESSPEYNKILEEILQDGNDLENLKKLKNKFKEKFFSTGAISGLWEHKKNIGEKRREHRQKHPQDITYTFEELSELSPEQYHEYLEDLTTAKKQEKYSCFVFFRGASKLTKNGKPIFVDGINNIIGKFLDCSYVVKRAKKSSNPASGSLTVSSNRSNLHRL